jgi:hypothetical protein
MNCESQAKEMWKKPEIRAEFSDDIETLIAYLENKDRVKSYKGSQAKATKAQDTPKAAGLDDTALKARWNASKALQDEFDGNFESYRQYMLHKNRVKVWN